MAHEPSDGPLGLEGRHEFKGGDQMPPGANNESSVFMYGNHAAGKAANPLAWIKVERVVGLHGLGDADDNREAAEGRSGDIVYPSAQRGKTIVYEGLVIGAGYGLDSLKAMRTQASALRRVAAETRERRTGSMTIVDPGETGAGYASGLRCIGFDMDDEQTRPLQSVYPWQRKFTLGLRMHDPRFEWFPVSSELANGAGDTITLTNEGYAPADLKFDIEATDEIMSVLVENLTLGKNLTFQSLPMPTEAFTRVLHLDWSQRAAVRPEVALPGYTPNTDMMRYYDAETSDWWDALEWGLGPGDNDIKVSGTNVGDWDVYFQHSSY